MNSSYFPYASAFGSSYGGYSAVPIPQPHGYSSVVPVATGYAAPIPAGSASANAAAATKSTAPATTTSGSSTLSGYDAAVYAAATSYLQSKTSGTTKQWLHKSGGGSSGNGGFRPFPPRKTGGGNSFGGSRPTQLHYCEICKISCAGQQTYREHLEGQKHKKKAELSKGGEPGSLAKNKNSFKCEVCCVVCSCSDAYEAHVRGKSHQRALRLQTQLGKPLPSQPTIISPSKGGKTIATGSNSVVVGLPKTSWVGGETLHTTSSGMSSIGPQLPSKPATKNAVSADTNEPKPVGEDYFAPEMTGGRLTGYHCKLCDCSFTDLQAKDMHAKGRRHRLNYKKKVDPSLQVEMPKSIMGRFGQYHGKSKAAMDFGRRSAQSAVALMPQAIAPAKPLFASNYKSTATSVVFYTANQNSLGWVVDNDAYVMAKHNEIYPQNDELSVVQQLVTSAEKALKIVSDVIAEAEKSVAVETKVEAPAVTEERLLKGVMRVGVLAKGLLLRGDMNVQLVVLCHEKPTKTLLKRVYDIFEAQFKDTTENYEFAIFPDLGLFTVKTTGDIKATMFIRLTSVAFREAASVETAPTTAPDASDVLNKQKCLDALAELRHAKWFQARCANFPTCLILLRVLRDLCNRVPTWAPLPSWALELLAEKIFSGVETPLSPGDAFRRVFEVVGSGALLPNGPGLIDPCEKEKINALDAMHPQQREDITASAQHALRLVSFNQINKVLGMDLLPEDGGPFPESRKRVAEPGTDDIAVKKEKNS